MAPEVKSFAYGVDFSPPLLQQMADLNKIIEDDDDALADRLFIIDKMFTYHNGINMQNFIRFPAKIPSKICANAQKKSHIMLLSEYPLLGHSVKKYDYLL